jgi:hypothetical protein
MLGQKIIGHTEQYFWGEQGGEELEREIIRSDEKYKARGHNVNAETLHLLTIWA